MTQPNTIIKFRIGASIKRKQIFKMQLKAHCRGDDLVNKTIKMKRIRQGSVISLYSEIHKDDNDLIPFILETKHDSRASRISNYSKARALLLISTSQLCQLQPRQFAFKALEENMEK